MKVFATITVILTSIMINQLLSYGLFKKPNQDHGQINRCQIIDITPIDLQQYQNEIYYLTFDGIYNNKQSLIYEQKNSYAIYSDQHFVYIAHDNQIDQLLDWNVQQTIVIPKSIKIYDFIVIHNKILITIDFSVSDIIGFYFKTDSFSLVECDFQGECQFIYEISGIHLSGIEYYQNNIIILDTFKKQLRIYDENKSLITYYELDDGPQRLVKINNNLYFTAIPKLIELLTLPKFTSLYEFKENKIQQLYVFEHFYYASCMWNEQIIMGNHICE